LHYGRYPPYEYINEVTKVLEEAGFKLFFAELINSLKYQDSIEHTG
jgi:hypothetical protein